MTYPDISSINATEDLSQILIYVNTLTNDAAIPMILGAFFVVAFIGSAFANMKFRGLFRVDFSFAAAGFSTFGLAVLLSLRSGLLQPAYFLVSLAVAILGAVILYWGRD